MRITAISILILLGVLFSFSDSLGGFKVSQKNLITAPYHFNLVKWEVGHIFDKWFYKSKKTITGHRRDMLPGIESVRRYFDSVSANRRRQELISNSDSLSYGDREILIELISTEKESQDHIKPVVEASLEHAVGSAIDELGISGKLGPLRWPPVHFVFEPSPLLLVTSPKDRIQRLDDILLEHDLDIGTKEEIESQIDETLGVSSLIVKLGGVATYPAHVSNHDSLHSALVMVSHEWLHHHLFFRPLGFCCMRDPAMISVNETVASIAGKEIGDLAFTLLTGETIEKPIHPEVSMETPGIRENQFDFRSEMRKTRIHLDGLLTEEDDGQIDGYLESRRKIFVENGFNIRKLNTAYFAFYGTYGTNPASASPIEAQVRAIRSAAGDLSVFLTRVSSISSYEDWEGLARDSGWARNNG